jgi:hypothetical protein
VADARTLEGGRGIDVRTQNRKEVKTMEYTAPVLHVVGTAQALVLGGNLNGDKKDNITQFRTSMTLDVVGLDD